jgi:addiction module HigA family antidote
VTADGIAKSITGDSASAGTAATPTRSKLSIIIEEPATMADFSPTHPGDVLREDFLKPLGLSRYALAKALGVAQMRIGEIAAGKRAVTPDTALRLARYFGTTAEF